MMPTWLVARKERGDDQLVAYVASNAAAYTVAALHRTGSGKARFHDLLGAAFGIHGEVGVGHGHVGNKVAMEKEERQRRQMG